MNQHSQGLEEATGLRPALPAAAAAPGWSGALLASCCDKAADCAASLRLQWMSMRAAVRRVMTNSRSAACLALVGLLRLHSHL